MKKFKNLYRIESNRRKNWDYSGKGNYFVTICTKNRKSFFGKIIDEKMYLNDLGNELQKQWLATPGIRPEVNITIDEFQVMPNHFHGIIDIGWNKYNENHLQPISSLDEFLLYYDDINIPSHVPKNAIKIFKNGFGPQSNNLASILRGFKSAVTTYARLNKIKFGWQANYHDIIIRDERALKNIRNYIRNNPKNWKKDRFRK